VTVVYAMDVEHHIVKPTVLRDKFPFSKILAPVV
jgi:hypothetical protein